MDELLEKYSVKEIRDAYCYLSDQIGNGYVDIEDGGMDDCEVAIVDVALGMFIEKFEKESNNHE